MEIPETLDAGPITLRRWTADFADDLDRAISHDLDNPASGRVAAEAGFVEVSPVDGERKAPADSGTHLVWAHRLPVRSR